MTRRRRVVAGIASVVLLTAAAGGLSFKHLEHRARVRAMPKVLASLSYALQALAHERPELVEPHLPAGDATSWLVLDAREQRQLIGEAARHADAPREWTDSVATDAW